MKKYANFGLVWPSPNQAKVGYQLIVSVAAFTITGAAIHRRKSTHERPI